MCRTDWQEQNKVLTWRPLFAIYILESQMSARYLEIDAFDDYNSIIVRGDAKEYLGL